MSPLVRSLLAIAALLATAATDDPPNRTKVLIGKIRPPVINLYSYYLPAKGGPIWIAYLCGDKIAPGSHIGGLKIIATNNDPSGGAPVLYFDSAHMFDQFEVKCPDDCPQGVTVAVREYCTTPS